MKTPEQRQTDILAIINSPNLDIIFFTPTSGLKQYIIRSIHKYSSATITISRDYFLLFFPVYRISVNHIPITVPSAKKLWQAAKKRMAKEQEQEIDAAIQSLAQQQ